MFTVTELQKHCKCCHDSTHWAGKCIFYKKWLFSFWLHKHDFI